jgi:hypothetical protein
MNNTCGWCLSTLVGLVSAIWGSPLDAQVPCAACNANKIDLPLNQDDSCTGVAIAWTRNSSGDCALNPAPKCLPNKVCLFSGSVTIVDLCGGMTYTSEWCVGPVNSAGGPITAPLCGNEGPIPPGFVIAFTDYAVACGTQEYLQIWCYPPAGAPRHVVAKVGGVCTGCPAQPQQPPAGV